MVQRLPKNGNIDFSKSLLYVENAKPGLGVNTNLFEDKFSGKRKPANLVILES